MIYLNETKQIMLKVTNEMEEKIEEMTKKGGYRSRQEFILDAVRKAPEKRMA
ncbi:MAG: ribbon-helix-helix domain-containing protein [Thermoplasmatales archaeon]